MTFEIIMKLVLFLRRCLGKNLGNTIIITRRLHKKTSLFLKPTLVLLGTGLFDVGISAYP